MDASIRRMPRQLEISPSFYPLIEKKTTSIPILLEIVPFRKFKFKNVSDSSIVETMLSSIISFAFNELVKILKSTMENTRWK